MIAVLLALFLQEGDFKAGAAAVDATPTKFPVIVNGMFTGRNAKGAVDPILVRSLVLDDGTTRIALTVVDSCMVPRVLLDRAKEAASKTTGIPSERMLVSATHTHSAPSAMGCLGSEPDPDYPAFLEKKISEAIEKAAANLVAVELGWAVAQAPEHTYCRRWILRPDKVRNDPFGVRNVRAMMHPGYQNPDFIGPAGPVDADLSLLAVRTRDGKPLALVANYSMHYFGSGLVSADYYGAFCRQFAKAIGADASFVPMMSQGTSGDQMWMNYGSPQKKIPMEEYAGGVTRIAHEAWKSIAYKSRGSIAMKEAKLTLKRRLCDETRLEWAKKVVAGLNGRPVQSQPEIYAREQLLLHEDPQAELKLQAIRIGDLGITAIPNEVVGITGLRLKARSPLQPTFNVELANGAEGYIPPPEQHKLGGYITWAARTAGLEVEAEPRIVETLLKLLEEVAGKPRRPFAEPSSPYAEAVRGSKPFAYWRMGEFTGTTAADSVGTLGATFEDGVALYLDGPPLAGSKGPNRAPHFAGGRMRAVIPGRAPAWSVELWLWNGFSVTGQLFSRGSSNSLGLNAGRLFFDSLSGKTEIPVKAWRHVVAVRNGESVVVYLDGKVEIEGKVAAEGDATLLIGSSFEGRIDEVAYYSRALSAEDVAAHTKAAAPPGQGRSHPPMRPLPVATGRPLAAGPKLYVDAARGDDGNSGTAKDPWKTLAHALRRLKPGDTLYLRGGTYYEKVFLSRSGTAEAPITIASHPSEVAVIDGGLREFLDSPATAWEPFPGGAEGEFVSTRAFPNADDRKVPHQFLPASWEPLWGIEDDRPLALGQFADSMVPLHGYRISKDLRSSNELWHGKKEMDETGLYCGPGLWFNRETGRIHIRLAHHRLAGLGDRAYRGETDPRKLPLVIAVGFGDDVLRVNGVRHVRLEGLVLRGATGSPLVHVYGSENVALDHLTVYGGFPALMVNASKNIRVTHSAFRGLAAPWTSRAHMKYRGTASYQVILQNDQPGNENIELAWCEFTDDHDFAFLRFVRNLQFHHNFVDNFNDDGLECGAKLRAHTLFIHQNRIGRCLIPLTQHEIEKDESPVDHDPKAGVFVYRNVIDLRGGVYKAPPPKTDASGDYLRDEGHLVGDHGGPTWPVLRVYHNTVLRHTPVFRDYFLFGLGAQGLRNTERDVFNNIFVQTERVPGANFGGARQAESLREGGNLIWGMMDGPSFKGDPFAKFRASPLFAESRKRYEPGWTTHDRLLDPKFARLTADESQPADLRLQAESPALNAGQKLPPEWPDPIRAADKDAPDIGALPAGVDPWGVGVDGRISLFGGSSR